MVVSRRLPLSLLPQPGKDGRKPRTEGTCCTHDSHFHCSGIYASLFPPALVFGTKSPSGTDLAHSGTLGFGRSAINQPLPSVPCRNLRGMRCTHTVFDCTRRSLAADDRQHSTSQPAWCLHMGPAVSAGAAISTCRSRP
ncbi:hypothetical protein K456DRAFT_1636788 [Colletotrichum gloeosporioides 23]|nr:hypothetical protein K456DRAFT_1636788 [Colletotrichum gloeosporioides 23]